MSEPTSLEPLTEPWLHLLEADALRAAKRHREYVTAHEAVVQRVIAMRRAGVDEEAIRARLTVAKMDALSVLTEAYRRSTEG